MAPFYLAHSVERTASYFNVLTNETLATYGFGLQGHLGSSPVTYSSRLCNVRCYKHTMHAAVHALNKGGILLV